MIFNLHCFSRDYRNFFKVIFNIVLNLKPIVLKTNIIVYIELVNQFFIFNNTLNYGYNSLEPFIKWCN
ncbi:hypothetical protein BGP_2893 [Beggiatoa sp. PS]|nr:hypothetical protein BGP_2893 [Beggiatoa sp. PS]